MNLIKDIWKNVRPYLVKLLADAIICYLLWVTVWAFQLLSKFLPIHGWAGVLFEDIHSYGAVLALATFSILFIKDIYEISKHD